MHSYNTADGTVFHYNSDLSGKVLIDVPGEENIQVSGYDLLEFMTWRHTIEDATDLPAIPHPAYRLFEAGVIFTERELRLILNCQKYFRNDPAGLPGHNLMIIISKFDQLVGRMASYLTLEQVEQCVAICEIKEESDEHKNR